MQPPYEQASPGTAPFHSRRYHSFPPQRSMAPPTRSRLMHSHLHYSSSAAFYCVVSFAALHLRKHRTRRYPFAFAHPALLSTALFSSHRIAFSETQNVTILFRFGNSFFQRCFRPHSSFYRVAFLGDTARHDTLLLFCFFSRAAFCCIVFILLFFLAVPLRGNGLFVHTFRSIASNEYTYSHTFVVHFIFVAVLMPSCVYLCDHPAPVRCFIYRSH